MDPGVLIPEGEAGAIEEELAVEFTGLFLGPGAHISPHESVHSQGPGKQQLWGECTAQVSAFIQNLNLELDDECHLIPDHISVELEVMSLLCMEEARAWSANDRDTACLALQHQRDFLNGHLIGWVPSFCILVREHARLPFYSQLADLTSSFLAAEQSLIEDALKNGEEE